MNLRKKKSLIKNKALDQKLRFISENFYKARALKPDEKKRLFSKIIAGIVTNKKKLHKLIVEEIKFTQLDAQKEIDRCIETFSIAEKNVWEGHEDFFGADMHWSHYGSEKNSEIVSKAGFEILINEIDDAGGEKHQVIIGEKYKVKNY